MALIYIVKEAGLCHVIGLSTDTKPAVGTSDGWSFNETDTGKSYLCDGAVWDETTATGAAAWGGLTGTLSTQSDLQAALDAKGTSNFDGVYASLTSKPTLGTAAATAIGDYATAAQGALAASALQSIANGSITLAKQADMATASVVYRKTGGAGAPEVNTLATLKTDLTLVKGDVGLGNVDNTTDAGKPVSTAQQTALNLKATLASPTFTGTVVLPANQALTTPAIGAATGTSVILTGAITSSSATTGLGYAAGAGGAVTQLTSKATATPSINKMCGKVTMNAAALAADTSVTHTLTNTSIATEDMIVVNHDSGGTLGAYNFAATAGAGSATVTLHNLTPASKSEAVVYNFMVFKGVVS